MTTLVTGASGKTGKLLVNQLLQRGETVKIVVRGGSEAPPDTDSNSHLTTIRANLLDLTDSELEELVRGCKNVVCCLGHNTTFKGIFGQPRRLVTTTVQRVCKAVSANDPAVPVKFVLLNSCGVKNNDEDEQVSVAERTVVQLLRALVPPHADNEAAAEFLRSTIGQDNSEVEWVSVRPDSLLDHEHVSDYEVFASPQRSAIFNSGSTSRINLAAFMAELVSDDKLWIKWQGTMPVIYNTSDA